MDHQARRPAGKALSLAALLGLTFVTLLPQGAAAQKPRVARTLNDLGGVNSFSPPLATEADLQRLFETAGDDLRAVLAKARWQGDPEDLFRAVADGEATERGFAVGDRLQWMAYRVAGRVDATGEILWAGQEPFEAFEVQVPSNGWLWTFIVPKVCGNLALHSRTGTSEMVVSVASGMIQLTTADGREVTLGAGDSETVSVPGLRPGAAAATEPAEAWLDVGEGDVTFSDHEGATSLFLEKGNRVGAKVRPGLPLSLEVPASNPEPIRIRIGDATGTVSPGTSAGIDWPAPVCALEASPAEACSGEPFTFDAGASSVRRGAVESVELEVTRPDGSKETLEPEQPGVFRWTRSFDAPGSFRVAAVAIGGTGKRSTNDCAASFEVSSCEPPAPGAPVCALSLSADDVDPFDELGVDASGSTAEGELTAVRLQVTAPDGSRHSEAELAAPYTTALTFERGGIYNVQAVAVDALGQTSEPCEATVDVYPRNAFAGSLLAGFQERRSRDASPILGGKAGLRRIMSRGLELLVSVGGVHDVDRSEDSALFAEIELDWRLGSRGFLGLGAGAWDLGEDAEAAVLLSFGRDLRLHVGRRPARLVLEGRFFPDTSGEDLVIVGGLRFLRP